MLSRPSAALAALAAVASFALAGCSSDDGDGATATDDSSTSAPAAGSGPACSYPSDGTAARAVNPPPSTAALPDEVDADIATNAGDIEVELDAADAPCTVNSFVSLADQGYFDDTICHRLTTAAAGIQVLQCGDPDGTGAGGPGYRFDDELTGSETYPAGTLAMANAGSDTNGSQFFIVYGDTPLPPKYTVFGTVDDDGLKVVTDIAAKGTVDGGPDGPPLDEVRIEKITTDD